MDGSLARLIGLAAFPTGRRIFALTQVVPRAKARAFPELAKHCTAAVAHDRGCLALERTWAGLAAAPKLPVDPDAPPDAATIDPLLDRTLAAIRDHALAQTAGAPADDPIHTTVASLLRAVFPSGVEHVTTLPFPVELVAVRAILARFEAPTLAPTVADLGLGRLVKRLADLTTAYAAALAAPTDATMAFGDVRAARSKGQDMLLEAVALVIAKHPRSALDDAAARAHLLGPIVAQDEDIAAAIRGRRAMVDVNPDTGSPDPAAPLLTDPGA